LFLTICLNPTIQKTISVQQLQQNEINRTQEHSLDISGKGINVSRVLTSLGASVMHLTHLGGLLAPFFKAQAQQEGLILHAVPTGASIRICVTLLEKKAGATTEIIADGYTVDKRTEGRIRQACQKLIPRCQAVIISGSKTFGYSNTLFPDIVRLARKAQKFVICDYRGEDLLNSLEYQPDVIKPNASEFAETFFPSCDPQNRDEGLTALITEKMRFLTCERHITSILTDGARAILYTDNNSIKHYKPPPITPVNTTGCGDAFTAGFAFRFLAVHDMTDAVKKGAECALQNALHLRPGVIGATKRQER
jgi:1-phosphofructokinase family hexose kinase